jgi:signal transduction histidine kinase
MALPFSPDVVDRRIFSMGFSENRSDFRRMLGDGLMMDMIVHEAIARDLEACVVDRIDKDFQIKVLIAVGKEDRLPAVSSLREVMGNVRDDDSRDSRPERVLLFQAYGWMNPESQILRCVCPDEAGRDTSG